MRELPLMPIAAATIVAGTIFGVVVASHLKPVSVDADEEYLEDYSLLEEPDAPELVASVPAGSDAAPTGKVVVTRRTASAARKLPAFRGFEDARYQRYDRLLVRLVDEFNAARGDWAGATASQGRTIRKLDAALVKALIIQESGGSSSRSRAAWMVDPAQVNVPGDWSPYKKYLGLRKPRHRNEGTAEQNLRAAIKFLVRKGFGVSGQPAANRPQARFENWSTALRRYNGRQDLTRSGRRYCDVYAERIVTRAATPGRHVPIHWK